MAATDFFRACPLCGETTSATVAHHEAVLRFVRCDACSLVYKREADPSLLARYDEAYFVEGSQGYSRKFEHRVRKALAELALCEARGWTPTDTVLDVGCSYGYVLEAARRRGLAAVGVDLSDHAVEQARSRGHQAKKGALEALPIPSGSISLALGKHVLEHSEDPGRALDELHRVLAPGGFLYVAVPDLDYWKARAFPQRYSYFDPARAGWQHHVYYSERTLPKMVEAHGFTSLGLVSRLPLASLRSALGIRHELCLVARRASGQSSSATTGA